MRGRRLVVLMVLLLGSHCANSQLSTAYQTLQSLAQALTASVTTFETFDAGYQTSIVNTGKSQHRSADDIESDLRHYRSGRVVVLKALTDAAAIVQTGRALLPLVEQGSGDSSDVTAWLGDAFNASRDLQRALGLLGVPTPSPAP